MADQEDKPRGNFCSDPTCDHPPVVRLQVVKYPEEAVEVCPNHYRELVMSGYAKEFDSVPRRVIDKNNFEEFIEELLEAQEAQENKKSWERKV